MIYLASDHAGFEVKEAIKSVLQNLHVHYEDMGVMDKSPADYPQIVEQVVPKLKSGSDGAILVCGSGTGMCMAANRYKHVRAGVGYDAFSAQKMREDEDANVLCLRARAFDPIHYEEIITAFINTPFSGEARHQRRIQELEELGQ